MHDYRILHGDAEHQVATLPTHSVHCIVTSPPYYGLRDYGVAGQIGLEPTVGEYVARLVAVLDACRRVLRDDGTLWLNLGDSYNSGSSGCLDGSTLTGGQRNQSHSNRTGKALIAGLKPKDLIGIPWRVAFALQDAGWWLRAEIIWHKLAPMPESVTDRPTRSHEQIFLLAKSARYFYDAEAVRERDCGHNGARPYDPRREGVILGRDNDPHGGLTKEWIAGNGRNQRDVWTLSPEPYPDAHFATFPTEIPRRAILAGTSAAGCCPTCGAPWQRVVERSDTPDASAKGSRFDVGKTKINGNGRTQPGDRYLKQATGWRPTCTCPAADPIPCTVLDPFGGSGTTAAVAVGLGRQAILVELNAAYIELSHTRIANVQRPLLPLT